ncbi:hypothetical protein R1T40_08670 [Tritonibacter scottomollicae]|uniref:Uncharacterized protein n=2 Tax=Tritonibacter scottomollicae TaxID=483013 RepID=A0ABZ0HJD1_TRISK|nr:hypothetical protein R1T40_08670 [Tritonibacter scottomollicae]
MEFFAMIFAIWMIAAAIAATILVGMFAGGIWGALAFAALLVVTYRAMTYQNGPARPMKRDQLNAFQRPLSDD